MLDVLNQCCHLRTMTYLLFALEVPGSLVLLTMTYLRYLLLNVLTMTYLLLTKIMTYLLLKMTKVLLTYVLLMMRYLLLAMAAVLTTYVLLSVRYLLLAMIKVLLVMYLLLMMAMTDQCHLLSILNIMVPAGCRLLISQLTTCTPRPTARTRSMEQSMLVRLGKWQQLVSGRTAGWMTCVGCSVQLQDGGRL